MALVFKPLRCPHCEKPINKPLLKQHGLLQTFLKRQPFACPHCQEQMVLPEKYEVAISSGVFLAVFIAPLFHLWDITLLDPRFLFGLGAVLAVGGLLMQKLHKA